MNQVVHFQMLARYHRIANEGIFEACAKLDEAEYRKPRSGRGALLFPAAGRQESRHWNVIMVAELDGSCEEAVAWCAIQKSAASDTKGLMPGGATCADPARSPYVTNSEILCHVL